jgi:hypothetical protein
LEFTLLKDNKELVKELTSHKLNDTTASVIKMVIAAGLYPQLAVEDVHNNHRAGHDQFAHTAKKPFGVLHPNSSLGQIPECLDIPKDPDGASAFHQIIFFGLMLETTKPFLCNTARIPALFLLVTARNITRTSPQILSCDGFVEFHFSRMDHCDEALQWACDIRRLFLQCVERKLYGEDYGSYRDLQRKIVHFTKSDVPYSIKRFVNPPKTMPSGIFTEDGEELLLFATADDFSNEPKSEADMQMDLEFDEKKVDEKTLGEKAYFCEECKTMLHFQNNADILRHKRSHQ